MNQIFISHSKNDKNLDFFHKGFSLEEIRATFMEYEPKEKPSWEPIKDNINNAWSVFVLLCDEIEDLKHTQNWISFEVGLACQAEKNVWVFEKKDNKVNFAVPYFTNYFLYDPEDGEHLKWLGFIIRNQGLNSNIGYTNACPSCGIEYNLIYKPLNWTCPCCQEKQYK